MSATKTQSGQSNGAGNRPATPVAAGGSPPRGLSERVRDYWQTLVYEWRKISWPERKQWKDSTIVVFVFVIVLMILLASFDWIVGMLMNELMTFGS
jgi:preprotein translocase SecE subunit